MQQLNLLNPALRPPRHRLTLSMLAVALVLIAVGLGVSALLTTRKAAVLELQVQEAETRQRTLQARADFLSAQAKREPDAGLAATLLSAKARLEATHEVVNALDSGGAGEGYGYSSMLAGLARQSLYGVWLTGVGAAGPALDIRGRLLDANLMPEYLRRLKGDGAFQGRRFGDFLLLDHPGEDKAKANGGSAPAGDERLPSAEPGPRRYVEFDLKAYAVPVAATPSGGTAAPSVPPLPVAASTGKGQS